MDTLQKFGVLEQDAIVRIREMADAEGERRFRGIAAETALTLGEYDGRPCALVRDVATVFGVTERAVRKALLAACYEVPYAAIEATNANASRLRNLKFRSRTPKATLIFWPGFLACALRGRSDVARRIALDLVRVEERERVAVAAGQVLTEEAAAEIAGLRRIVSEDIPRLRRIVAEDIPRLRDVVEDIKCYSADLGSRVGRIEDASDAGPTHASTDLDWRQLRERRLAARELDQVAAKSGVPARDRLAALQEALGLSGVDLAASVFEAPTKVLGVDGDEVLRAVKLVIAWADAHPNEFYWPNRDGAGPFVGRRDDKLICFFPDKLRQLLGEYGFTDGDVVVKEWRARGWLVCDRDSRSTKRVSVGPSLARVVAINRAAVLAASRPSALDGEGGLQ